jgi:hypothetical protein
MDASGKTTASVEQSSDQGNELLQKAAILESAARAFEFACAIIRWRQYCENNWCGGEVETLEEAPTPYIETEGNLIRSLAALLCGGAEAAQHHADFRRLSHGLAEADRDFRECFHSVIRRRLIETYERIDWEIQTEIGLREFWFTDSPFNRPSYQRFRKAAWRVVSNRETLVKVCFRLGLLAESERHGILCDRIASEKGIPLAVLLQERIAPRLQRLFSQLDGFEQVLAVDKLDIRYETWRRADIRWGYQRWAQRRLRTIAETFPDRLHHAETELRNDALRVNDQPSEVSSRPSWRSDIQVLSYCGVQCKYKRSAPKQTKVLDAFEQSQWGQIRNPFIDSKGKPEFSVFKDAVNDLNKKCRKAEIAIRFSIATDHQTGRWHDVPRNAGVAAEVPASRLESS